VRQFEEPPQSLLPPVPRAVTCELLSPCWKTLLEVLRALSQRGGHGVCGFCSYVRVCVCVSREKDDCSAQ
jgi:hypothetical protein